MKKLLVAALSALLIAPAASAAAPVGFANVMGARSWESMQNPPYGIYSFTMDANPHVKLVAEKVVPANFGAVYVDGRYFVMEGIATSASSFITNYIYDAETWTKITDFRGENITALDMAWDETTGNVYGYFHNFGTNEEFFGTIDIETGKTTSIAKLSFQAYGLGCDVEGNIYAIAKNGDLYTVNKATGATALIGKSGCSTTWSTAGAIDSSTRTFYYVCCNDTESVLYGINLDTAAATRITEIPDEMQLRGLYFPDATALPKAPAKAESLTFDFPGGALSGNFTFSIPATLNDGSAPTGTVDYTVTVNGEQKAAATAQYGQKISVPLTFAQALECNAKVMLRNTVGSAPVATLKGWIGPDVPAPAGSITLDYDGNGNFSLSWPEAKSLHGGWFDPATVTYNLTRYSSDADPVHVNGLTLNSYTDKVPLPGEDEYATYHYDVTVLFGSAASSSTSSEFYTIGSQTPPFTEQFSQRWSLGKFTIFEGSKKDYDRWNWSSADKAVTVVTNTSTGADDYLLLPPLMLDRSMIYNISFDVKGKYDSDTERFEVLAGVSPYQESLTETVLEPTEFKGTEYRNISMEFAPKSTGIWFIAIHAISDPNKGAITIDNIKVDAGVVNGVEGIEDDSLQPAEYYTLQGVRIASPAKGQMVIVRRGGKAFKAIF